MSDFRMIDEVLTKKIKSLEKKRFNSADDYHCFLKFACDVGRLEVPYLFGYYIDSDIDVVEEFKSQNVKIKRIFDFSLQKDILKYQATNDISNPEISSLNFLKESFWAYFRKLVPEVATSKENMLLSYLFYFYIKNSDKNSFTDDDCIEVFKYFNVAKNCNSLRRNICCLLIIEYCIANDFSNFFRLPIKFYNHVTTIFSKLIYSGVFNEEEQELFMSLFLNKIRKNNSFHISHECKIAVCVSGQFRNHSESLKSIRENLIDPLNADVFVHSWEEGSVWSGFGGSPHRGRVFGKESFKHIPEELHKLSRLDKYFPISYKLLTTPIVKSIDFESDFKLLTVKDYELESEENFIKTLGATSGYTKLRGSLNQIKMFYGIKKSFDLALDSGKYDFIIRCRPDLFISEKITKDQINNLKNNTIYTKTYSNVALTDIFFTMNASMAYNFSRFVELIMEKQALSPFDSFPEYDSHNLLTAWMISNNYFYDREIASTYVLPNQIVSIKGLKAALKKDYSNLIEADKLKMESTVKYLIKRNG